MKPRRKLQEPQDAAEDRLTPRGCSHVIRTAGQIDRTESAFAAYVWAGVGKHCDELRLMRRRQVSSSPVLAVFSPGAPRMLCLLCMPHR